jgi:hypothetical protein
LLLKQKLPQLERVKNSKLEEKLQQKKKQLKRLRKNN